MTHQWSGTKKKCVDMRQPKSRCESCERPAFYPPIGARMIYRLVMGCVFKSKGEVQLVTAFCPPFSCNSCRLFGRMIYCQYLHLCVPLAAEGMAIKAGRGRPDEERVAAALL